MLFSTFLVELSALFFNPARTLKEIYFKYRDRLFKYGILTVLLVVIIRETSDALLSASAVNVSAYISELIFKSLIVVTLYLVQLALIHFILGLYGKQYDTKQLSGLYLISDAPYLILLPLALIFQALPFLPMGLYYFFVFTIFILVFYIKMKSIEMVGEVSLSAAVGLIILPVVLLVLVLISSFVLLVMSALPAL